ncbi:uncharacterized protein METZ01_LOCUS410482 [marine metagenome]|uniref:Uncharacterized protein n=1 Tax=marine metagenome TaxID=408172 RepID=A0A382WHN0_9ZZZZ
MSECEGLFLINLIQCYDIRFIYYENKK